MTTEERVAWYREWPGLVHDFEVGVRTVTEMTMGLARMEERNEQGGDAWRALWNARERARDQCDEARAALHRFAEPAPTGTGGEVAAGD